MLNIPFALWGTTGWLEFFENSKSRPASWNSLWNEACKLATRNALMAKVAGMAS